MSIHFPKSPAGIYVHIPFCERLCPYCDFAVTIAQDIPHQEYGNAICRELQGRRREIDGQVVKTIYFGGGTPSLLAPEVLGEILTKIENTFEVDPFREVTVEANPNQITAARLETYRALGVTRLSLGCQSFQARHLKALRRNHSAEMALQAIQTALPFFPTLSFDLMFAGPSQTMEEWEQDLGMISALVDQGLTHLSAYNLTIEEGTAFFLHRKRGTLQVPDDDLAAEMLERLVEVTATAGLRRYEVSNFAIPGFESRHNSAYWQGRSYLGVGVGAHSLEVLEGGEAIRRANPRKLADYFAARPQEIEKLNAETYFRERLFLAVRTRFGADLNALSSQFGPHLKESLFEDLHAALQTLEDQGLIERKGPHFSPTNRGLDLSDTLATLLYSL